MQTAFDATLSLEVIRNGFCARHELEFRSNIQDMTFDVDYFDRLNQTRSQITPSWHSIKPIGAL